MTSLICTVHLAVVNMASVHQPERTAKRRKSYDWKTNLTPLIMRIRPPDIIVVGGLIGYIAILSSSSSSISSSSIFLVSYPPSSLSRTQPIPATCLEVSVIWKCMSKISGNTPRQITGAQNHRFSTTAQLSGKFNGLCFGTKHEIDNRRSALETTRHTRLYSFRVWSTLPHFGSPEKVRNRYFNFR